MQPALNQFFCCRHNSKSDCSSQDTVESTMMWWITIMLCSHSIQKTSSSQLHVHLLTWVKLHEQCKWSQLKSSHRWTVIDHFRSFAFIH